ncbi:MAG: VOC family protein [Proteobacteria bacterium]|nr:VOC family protein [Pseudomonadota bacterium]
MSNVNGIHHLAIMTSDVKRQIAFFSDVLGMELKALYWMHGVEGYFHAFMALNAHSSIAFVAAPAVKDIPTQMGVSHAGNPGSPCAAGAMQHVAFNVDDDEQLLAMRDRIRSRGVRVLGPLDHGFCKSIYFAGPENLVLEVSTSRAAIDAEAWIDPQVVDLNGISAEELERYKHPAAFTHRGGAVAQPAAGNGQPEYSAMTPAFAHAFDLPDEVVTRAMSESTPPVKVATR